MTTVVPLSRREAKRLQSVPKVLASLGELRLELSDAETFEQLLDLEQTAKRIRGWWGDVEEIKHAAEDLILDAHVRLGEETVKLERAKGGRPKTRSHEETSFQERVSTMQERGLTRKLVHQVQRLAAHKAEIAAVVTRLREQGKDATPSAVVRELTQGDKRFWRQTKERELGERQKALPTHTYGVIYADPPWSFEPYSVETGMDRAADNHYPTMSVEAICALEPPAADDCVLFLWATVPMLPQALEVMAVWGFDYRSHFVWVKDKVGTGYWNRNRHELLLVGVRGHVPAPAPGEQYASVIEGVRAAHSAKPFAFHEMIETMFPTLPRLEMFARGEAFAGWERWGQEA